MTPVTHITTVTFKRVSVRPVRVSMHCPTCGDEMERSNEVLASYPPQYQYHCKVCGTKHTTREIYPRMEYEEAK
jgi:uncharacterized Zn finger protein